MALKKKKKKKKDACMNSKDILQRRPMYADLRMEHGSLGKIGLLRLLQG